MTPLETDESTRRKSLRLWPGVVAVAVQWLAWFLVPLLRPDAAPIGFMAALLGGPVVLLWWIFFSRADWVERLATLPLIALGVLSARPLLHKSVATGMMGFMFFLYVIPTLSLALVAWAALTRRLPDRTRRLTLVATVALACGGWTLLRTGGISGDGESDFKWRWSQTAEERLLAKAGNFPAAPEPVQLQEERSPTGSEGGSPPPEGMKPAQAASAAVQTPAQPIVQPDEVATGATGDEPPSALSADGGPTAAPVATSRIEADWPGFRGRGRNGIVRGVRIGTDWVASPPVEIWRRPVGPGWSSFAVWGDLLYTQEQRGDQEVVSCYRTANGEPVWKHEDATRFWESNAGPGPRATPTLAEGHVYTFGATGILNALDATDGTLLWSRKASSDTGVKIPGWGFASSPLVVGDSVVVATAGRLVAYDLATGEPRWLGPEGGWGYASPQLETIHGVPQILLLNGEGVIAVAPADGSLLWRDEWPGDGILQPGSTPEGDILIGTGSGLGSNAKIGLQRIALTQQSDGWRVAERWASRALKPYFNDFVVHHAHAYGFDGGILACVDLQDGKRKWKGGRYGHGQILLLADQDLLLVLSEQGEIALVKALPDGFAELARFPAIQGKTWNHPVLAGDTLLVRNGEEMAAFRLPPG